ncbi:MAG: response regulator transcription factor [Thermoanaerobaculia bacterium]
MGIRLTDREIRSLSGFLREIYAARDSEEFATHATHALRRLLPADRSSYNEWYRAPGKFRSFVAPEGRNLDGRLGEAMALHGHESPMLAYYRRTRLAEVRVFSDFVTRPQLHRLPLYNEYYRHVDVEFQIIVPISLRHPPTREVGFALSRRRIDFSASDRRLLELVQPHLIQASSNALAVDRLRAARASLEGAMETGGQGVIVLSPAGSILFSTRRTRSMLQDYFGADRPPADRLPGTLDGWVRRETAAAALEAGISAPRRPLVRERENRHLTIRLVRNGDERLLLLEERRNDLDAESLAPLGLTPRQSEVLAWVARGKTNDEIASIVGSRSATVAKHLERIYEKLGVETRTAAAIEAFSRRRPNGE